MGHKADFLIVYNTAVDLAVLLRDTLRKTLSEDYDEPGTGTMISDCIGVRYNHCREDGNSISGITVDFDCAESEAPGVIHDFGYTLSDYSEDGILHVVKLMDGDLLRRNWSYTKEIFEIEMKVREALTFIFIDTYGAGFYSLLKDVDVVPADKELNDETYFRSHLENEFFLLLFSDYRAINTRRVPKNGTDIIRLIRESTDFLALQESLVSTPIRSEKYIAFMESLKQYLDPIERLRNCVAHNRAISRKVLEDYATAKDQLLSIVDDFLSKIGTVNNTETAHATQ
jgi:hypothetical protein